MSQDNDQGPERGDANVKYHYALSLSINRSQDGTIYGDSSGPLFAIYSKSVEKIDNMMAERWQKDAEGILIFNGLFSAVIAALVVVSIQDLRPNSQDTSAFYLEKIYQLQADPSVSLPSTPSTLVKPPAFSPPVYAIWVNSLLFLSLVISLTCAMLATSLQQWARRYLQNTQQAGRGMHERARIRAFFANGITAFHVPRVVEALPALVHLALFIFFAGLLVYFFNINHAVFGAVFCWVALLSAIYAYITFMPIFWLDSPFYMPLSPTAWFLYTRVPYVILEVLHRILLRFYPFEALGRIREWLLLFSRWKVQGIWWEIKEAISEQSAEIDSRILRWTVDDLRGDDELEKVFETIPGFFKSDEVKVLRDRAEITTHDAMGYFLRNTLSSNSVPKAIKITRLTTCLNATSGARPAPVFDPLIYVNWGGGLDSVDIGHSLRSWDKASKGRFTPYIRGVVAIIVASVSKRDKTWTTLARDHLGVQDDVFQDYLKHGDSVLLANLIHLMRHADRSEFFALGVVVSLSKFDPRNTLPELQRDFCALWNQVVQEAQDGGAYSCPVYLLREIRHHYVALHQAADASGGNFYFSGPLVDPSSYPLCNVSGHPSQPTQVVAAVSIEPAHPPATTFSIPSSSSSPQSWPVPITTHFLDDPSLADQPPTQTIMSSQPSP